MGIKIGSLIDERYRVTARIGHGGMADVYEANDIIYHRRVAIKLIREDVMTNPMNLRRFENEATIAASLNHPNIMKIYNHGTIDDRPYMVNEFIKGQTLKEILDFRGALPIAECISYMVQLTSAMDYAFKHNIIHRDIKPDNIFVLSDGSIKLGDFGIAQVSGDNNNLTKATDLVGSVHYMAPEVLRGKSANAQSDIYAAGITFFELLTARVPFEGENAVNVAVSQIKDKFPSIKKYRPDCPKEVEKIVLKSVSKNPNDRYQTAADFTADLHEIEKRPELLKEKKSLLSRIFGFK